MFVPPLLAVEADILPGRARFGGVIAKLCRQLVRRADNCRGERRYAVIGDPVTRPKYAARRRHPAGVFLHGPPDTSSAVLGLLIVERKPTLAHKPQFFTLLRNASDRV